MNSASRRPQRRRSSASSARAVAVAVQERMQRRKVVVQRQRLNQRVVRGIFRPGSPQQLRKGRLAVRAAGHAAVTGDAKRDVFVTLPQPAGRAMVVVRARNEAAMNFPHQFIGQWPVVGQAGNPAVGRRRRCRLPLRAGRQSLGRLPHRRLQFRLAELRPFDARRAGHLALELQHLQPVRPRLLQGHVRLRQHGSLRLDQLLGHRQAVVLDPAGRR